MLKRTYGRIDDADDNVFGNVEGKATNLTKTHTLTKKNTMIWLFIYVYIYAYTRTKSDTYNILLKFISIYCNDA